MDIQIRYDGGALTPKNNLVDALKFNNGDWDKISFPISTSERFIIYRDGSWEHRTPEALKAAALKILDKERKCLK